jgi:hypothetical protein
MTFPSRAKGVRETDGLSKAKAAAAIERAGMTLKSTADYIAAFEDAILDVPPDHTLGVWLVCARAAFARVLAPTTPARAPG